MQMFKLFPPFMFPRRVCFAPAGIVFRDNILAPANVVSFSGKKLHSTHYLFISYSSFQAYLHIHYVKAHNKISFS